MKDLQISFFGKAEGLSHEMGVNIVHLARSGTVCFAWLWQGRHSEVSMNAGRVSASRW